MSEYEQVIDHAYQSWLGFMRRCGAMLSGHNVHDESKSMSQNEAEWQSNYRYRIQHTMESYFPGVSVGFISEVMWNRYRQSRNLVQDPG